MNKCFLLTPCAFITFLLLNPAPSFAGPSASTAKICAGAYYFDGWTREKTQYRHLTPRLRDEFFDREPIWGWQDDSLPIVEEQINCAADHGLSFFAFDWYRPEGANKHSALNTGLELYLQATNKLRLQFCLMVANHAGYRIDAADWDALTDIWVRLFKEPTYLKVEGKPLLIFFLPKELRRTFDSSAGVKAAFDKLEAKARASGLTGVCLAACATPGPNPKFEKWDNLKDLQADGYSCLTGYNYHAYPMVGPDKIQPFSRMVEGHQDMWNRFATNSPLPYVPIVTTGWDKRPWEDPAKPETQEAYYPDRTPVQVADFVRRGIAWMDAHPGQTTKEHILLLYAWNENGEGGYLTPTKALGDAYLKAVGDALNTSGQ